MLKYSSIPPTMLALVEPEGFVRLESNTRVPPGGVAVSTEEVCNNCHLIARSLNYIVYAVPPYPELVTEPKRPLDVFQASIVAQTVPSTFHPGQKATIDLLVKNISAVEWPGVGELDGRYAVKLTARWRENTGTIRSEQDHAKRLPYDVEPGDTVALSLEIEAPAAPGEYTIELDLIQQGVGWFADHGSESAKLKVRVTPIE